MPQFREKGREKSVKHKKKDRKLRNRWSKETNRKEFRQKSTNALEIKE